MRHCFKACVFISRRTLLGVCLVLSAPSTSSQMFGHVPVNIFGDGNPDNGFEDNREQVMGGRQGVGTRSNQHLNAGTVVCDEKTRGTAMVVDTREYAPGLEGVILLTAAHVIYDLDKNRRFRKCAFHFMALSELPGYKARIDLGLVKQGDFDPREEITGTGFGEGDWVFLYVPKPWKNFSPDQAIALREFSFLQTESFQQSGGEFGLLAFSSADGAISLSRNCMVIESRDDDLGGGEWEGQLLDDCDSAGGASGGGIIAVLDGRQYLIGIRSGSHWDGQVFPVTEYPEGPPDGSLWNRHSNTNFGRAIDARMIRDLIGFVHGLKDGGTAS